MHQSMPVLCCRLDAHKHVLESATAVLLKRIQSMQTEGLLKLLADTFIYVSLLTCPHVLSMCAAAPEALTQYPAYTG